MRKRDIETVNPKLLQCCPAANGRLDVTMPAPHASTAEVGRALEICRTVTLQFPIGPKAVTAAVQVLYCVSPRRKHANIDYSAGIVIACRRNGFGASLQFRRLRVSMRFSQDLRVFMQIA